MTIFSFFWIFLANLYKMQKDDNQLFAKSKQTTLGIRRFLWHRIEIIFFGPKIGNDFLGIQITLAARCVKAKIIELNSERIQSTFTENQIYFQPTLTLSVCFWILFAIGDKFSGIAGISLWKFLNFLTKHGLPASTSLDYSQGFISTSHRIRYWLLRWLHFYISYPEVYIGIFLPECWEKISDRKQVCPEIQHYTLWT